MGLTIHTAAARLSRDFPQAEADIAQALVSSTALIHSMALASQVEGVPVGAGQKALDHALLTVQSLVTARGQVARTHGRMAEVHREVASGDVDYTDCVPKGVVELFEVA